MRPYSLPYYSHDCKRSQHNTVAFIFYSQSRHIAFTVTGTTVTLTLLNEFLTAGFPPHFKISVAGTATDVCKSEKVKSFGLTFATVSAVVFRKSAELDQPTLFFCQTKSKVRHPMFQSFVERYSLLFVLEAYHKIISIVDDTCIPFEIRDYDLIKPPKQDVVHVDVCQYWRTH